MIFTDFYAHTRQFLSSGKLLSKQMQSPGESLSGWLYRYLVLRGHFLLLLVYSGFSTQFSMVRCEHNSPFDKQFADTICLFNYTFVIRSPALDLLWEKGAITAAYRDALKHQDAGAQRQYLFYYPYIFQVIVILNLLNLAANLFSHWCLEFQKAFFTCSHECCQSAHSFDRFECRCRQSKCLLSSAKSKWFLRLSYLFTEIPPMIAIVLAMVFLNTVFPGNFLTLGWDWWTNQSPLRYMFPKLSKCDASYVSASGELLQYSSFCLLKYNYVNQAVFSALWLIYLLFSVAFLSRFIVKIAILAVPPMRQSCTKRMLCTNSFTREITFSEYLLLYYTRKYSSRVMAKSMSVVLAHRKYLAWLESSDDLQGPANFPFTQQQINQLLNESQLAPKCTHFCAF